MAEPFANPNALQRAVMARLNLLTYPSIKNTSPTEFTATVADGAAMNAAALYAVMLQASKQPGSGFSAALVDLAISEMYEAVVEADRLWPKAGDHTVPSSQVEAHSAAVKKVQEVAKRYGFTEREGYLLAYPEQVG